MIKKILSLFDKVEQKIFLVKIANWIRKFIENNAIYLIAASFLLGTFFLIYFAVDDSFIYLRYAKNFKEYGIWNWNPTAENPVEAYTGALYAFLPILPFLLNIKPQLFLDIIGLAILILFNYRIYQEAEDKFSRYYALLLLLMVPTTYVHFYSGMETPVFIFLTFEIFRIFYKIWQKESQNYNYFYFLAFAAAFTRSDGVILAAILFLALCSKENFRIKNIKSLLFWGAIGIVYFLWRYQYFGYLLPAPAYHKLAKGSLEAGRNLDSATLYLLPLISLLPLWIKRKNYPVLIISAICGVFCLMYIYSRLEMNYSDRFFYQICIPTLIFLFTKIKFEELRYKNIITFFAIIFLFKSIERGLDSKYAQSYTYSLYNSYAKVGKALSQFKGYTIMMGDCGILPYESGWYTYDSMGLANMHVAKNGISEEFLKETKPDAFILYSSADGKPNDKSFFIDPGKMKIMKNYMEKSGEYEYVDSFTSGNYYNAIFIKKNLADYKKISEEIKRESQATKDFFKGENPFPFQKITAFILAGEWLKS